MYDGINLGNHLFQMSLTWYLLAFAVAIAAVTAQDDVDHWQMQYYPDPQSDPAGCGRPRPSHVCDPNHMLTEREGGFE